MNIKRMWNRLQASIDELYAKIAGVEGRATETLYSVVLRAGDTSGAPNVFTTWAALYAACKGIKGGVRVLVDDTIASPAIIGAGGPYNVDGWVFESVANAANFTGGANLLILGQALVYSTLEIKNRLNVTYTGTTDCTTVGAAQEVNLYVSGEAMIQCSSTGAFANASGAGSFYLVIADSSTIGDGTHAVLKASGGSAELFAFNSSQIAAAALTGNGAGVGFDATSVPTGAQGANVAFSPGTRSQSTPFSLAAGHVCTPFEAANAVLVCTGVLGGNETLTLPASAGQAWDIDLSGVTLGGNTLTISAGGTTAAITAAELATTGAKGCRVVISGTNTVTRVS